MSQAPSGEHERDAAGGRRQNVADGVLGPPEYLQITEALPSPDAACGENVNGGGTAGCTPARPPPTRRLSPRRWCGGEDEGGALVAAFVSLVLDREDQERGERSGGEER